MNKNPKTVLVPHDRIDGPSHARKLNQTKTQDTAKSIIDLGGLIQPVGLIPVGDRFRLVWGNHRLHANKLAGRDEIESRILPPDTTPEMELSYSIQENQLRVAEDFEDTLARIEQHALLTGCSIAKAAKANGVSSSYVSKAQTTLKRLCPKVKALANEKNVGISVLYKISKAGGDDQQLTLLTGYLDGSLNREAIGQAIKKPKTSRSKNVSLKLVVDGVAVRLEVPSGVAGDGILARLNTLKRRVATLDKQCIPVHLWPDIIQQGVE